ncbi:MAG: hypothetical protein PHS56_06005 [Eubacteriales bacterium]|nr:hypothetical protein [Eubacteriales bacterium]MDD3073951.1 hypothetical protein [Eubacteriales bacterium]MDD4078268.1 hypothetical protein [Eubacteriales bacterium]HCX79182.1 hypothetical protein [Bacillota bacterium]
MKAKGQLIMAVCSIALGLLAGIWLWQIPFLGLPVAVGGLVLGGLTLKTERHNTALTGILICIVALFLVLVNLGLEYLIVPGKL